MTDASIQRGRLWLCKETDEPAAQAERGQDFTGTGHSRDHPLSKEEDLALQGVVVPASQKEPEGWSAADKFTVVMETSGLNSAEGNGHYREQGLFPEQVERSRQEPGCQCQASAEDSRAEEA